MILSHRWNGEMIEDITTLLGRYGAGETEAREKLLEQIYPDLKRLAGRRLSSQGVKRHLPLRLKTTPLRGCRSSPPLLRWSSDPPRDQSPPPGLWELWETRSPRSVFQVAVEIA